MSSTANAASVGQIRSGLRALGESLRRGRRKVCPVLGLIEIETASKSLFSLSVQNVSVCAKSNVGTLVVRNWSYEALEREVRANLVYRDFSRVGGAKMPDAKTMGRWGVALGPEVVKRVHDRIVAIARDEGIAAGRRMRVDTTVVETNIHHPSDSTLLGDGVRVLTRT